MKNIFSKFAVVALTLFAFKATAYANHQFSFNAYNCNALDENFVCVDDSGNELVDLVELSNEDDVARGKIIKLDVVYEPDPDYTDYGMQIRFRYNPDAVETVKYYDEDEGGYVAFAVPDMRTTYQGGMWPAVSAANRYSTNWSVIYNDATSVSTFAIEAADNAVSRKLTTGGVVISTYFKVLEDAPANELFNFIYDTKNTKMNNKSAISFENIAFNAYAELDSDTTLSNITVTSGSTNYLTNFNKDTKTYNVYVPNNVSSVTVTGTPNKETTTAVNDPSGAQTLSVSTTKTVIINTTAESGDTDIYTVNIYRLDNNSYLANLGLNGGATISPAFSATTTSYTANVPYTTSSITPTATTAGNNATVSGTTAKQLNVGDNTINIVVSPENCKSQYSSVPGNTCQTRTYTITVNRAVPDTNAYLTDLKIAGVSVPGFNKTTYEYTIDAVPNATTSVTVAPTKESSLSTLSGDTTSKSLAVGNNQIKVTVTAQDGTTKHTYTVNVKRKSNVAELSSLTVTSSPQGTLNPSTFSASTKTYTYTVGPDVTNVSIAATAGNGATVAGTGNYNPQTTNKAEIIVTPEDGSPVTYTVNLVRTKSTDVTLDELSVAGYTLSPAYSDSINSYNVTVPSTETSVNVTATAHDSRTTATVSGGTNLTTGNNTVTVTVTPENGVSSARTITITVKKLDGDATLKTLSLSGVTITPTFASGTKEYTATVPYTTSSTTVSATTNKTTTTITSGTGSVNLTAGAATTIKVKTKAEDPNVTDEYTVVVTRTAAATDNTLSDLKVDGVTVPGFEPNVTTYNLDAVASTKENVEITATKNNEFATIVSGTGTKTLTKNQNNALEVVVRSQSGAEKTYTINIRRQNDNAFLSSLNITSSDGSLDKAFNKNTLAYTYTVGPDVTSVEITGACEDTTNATVSGNGTIDPRTVTSKTIRCTAEDTNIYKDYVITIVRSKSTNVLLSNLEVDGYDINFDPSTNSYNLNIDSNVEAVTVIATKGDERQTLSDETQVVTTNNPGDYQISVTVTAEDTTKTNTYVVNVHKYSADASLSSLALSGVTISPAFSSSVTEYTATVPYTKTSTTLSATPISGASIVNSSDLGDKELVVGNTNVFTVTVEAEDGHTTKSYTVTVNRLAASGNAYLTDLKVDGTTVPGFDGENEFTYTLDDVSSSKDKITISATPNENSTIRDGDTGEKTLNVGNNTFEVVVIAQNGETRVSYSINVKRLDSNNNLDTLTITSDPDGELDKPFDPDTTEYTYTVGPDTGNITVSADPEGNATVDGEGTYDPKTTDTITITVTPEDGEPKEYIIHVNREKSTNNELLSLGVEGYTITPNFDKDVTSYTLSVPRDVDKATITAEVKDSNSSIDPSDIGEKNLNPGANTFTVTVTPEDPNAEARVYTIVITRVQGTDASLSSITVDGDPIPGFDPNDTEYTLPEVGEDVEFITIGAVPTDENADVSGDGVITLTPGENRIPITVTPEDPDADPVTYTIIINKALNDNKYLANLKVNGVSVPEFNKETNNYTVNVPADTETVSVSAEPEVETSTVSGTGDAIALTGDSTEITVTVTSQKGSENPYVITINKVDDAEFITSIVYGHTIDENYIRTVNFGTKPNDLKDQLDNDNNLLFIFKDPDKFDPETLYGDTENVGTGAIVKLIRNDVLKDSKQVIVRGDTNGDGNLTLFDAIKIFSHLLETEPLTAAYAVAADYDENENITLFDAIGIFKKLLE